jgi:hypothetical protein
MNHEAAAPSRRASVRRTTALVALLGLATLVPVALAADVIETIRITVESFQAAIDDRLDEIGEPATKADKAELKCLHKASDILGDTSDALQPLSAPDGLFATDALKGLAKIGGLIEKSGTADPDVQTGFQTLFQALDQWGEALDDIYDASRPSLTEKELAKVQKLAEKSEDYYILSMDYIGNGELGKGTKAGARALITFAKATFLAQMYAND